MHTLRERIVPDSLTCFAIKWVPCRRLQHYSLWIGKLKQWHAQITPPVKKRLGIQTLADCSDFVLYEPLSLGLCGTCRELP